MSVASSHEAAKLTITVGNGVASLQMTAIPTLNLDLIRDDDNHGRIVGIPFDDENYDLAMNLADKLLSLSVVTVERWNRRPGR